MVCKVCGHTGVDSDIDSNCCGCKKMWLEDWQTGRIPKAFKDLGIDYTVHCWQLVRLQIIAETEGRISKKQLEENVRLIAQQEKSNLEREGEIKRRNENIRKQREDALRSYPDNVF